MYLRIFDRLLVDAYSPGFRNFSGHRCTKPHHHVKVADHGEVSLMVFLLQIVFRMPVKEF